MMQKETVVIYARVEGKLLELLRKDAKDNLRPMGKQVEYILLKHFKPASEMKK